MHDFPSCQTSVRPSHTLNFMKGQNIKDGLAPERPARPGHTPDPTASVMTVLSAEPVPPAAWDGLDDRLIGDPHLERGTALASSRAFRPTQPSSSYALIPSDDGLSATNPYPADDPRHADWAEISAFLAADPGHRLDNYRRGWREEQRSEVETGVEGDVGGRPAVAEACCHVKAMHEAFDMFEEGR